MAYALVRAAKPSLIYSRRGVFYADSVDRLTGYADPEKGFQFVTRAVVLWRRSAKLRAVVSQGVSGGRDADPQGTADQDHSSPEWIADLLGPRYEIKQVRRLLQGSINDSRHDLSEVDLRAPRSLPCKVSIILVGKRHKATRQMILEAAASAVLRPTGENPVSSVRRIRPKGACTERIVGFDLAERKSANPTDAIHRGISGACRDCISPNRACRRKRVGPVH